MDCWFAMYLAQVGLKIRNSVVLVFFHSRDHQHVKSNSKWAESAVKSDGDPRMSYSQTLKFMCPNPLQNWRGWCFWMDYWFAMHFAQHVSIVVSKCLERDFTLLLALFPFLVFRMLFVFIVLLLENNFIFGVYFAPDRGSTTTADFFLLQWRLSTFKFKSCKC